MFFAFFAGTLHHVLIDVADYNLYKRTGIKKEVYVDNFIQLDDNLLASGHDDGKIRIFNFKEGDFPNKAVKDLIIQLVIISSKT